MSSKDYKIKNAAEEYITDPDTIEKTDAVVERLAQKQCMVDFA
jgi:hypothetical protein